MSELLLVRLPVWVAVAAWFVGAWARQRISPPVPRMTTRLAAPSAGESASAERIGAALVYRTAWLIGAFSVLFHIFGSYGWVHGWSHAAALAATAEEAERVTGIRAAWGVYVNFVFAIAWLAYALLMFRRGGPDRRLDGGVFWFTAAIVFAATVVFESGAVQILAAAGFVLLLISAILRRFRSSATR